METYFTKIFSPSYSTQSTTASGIKRSDDDVIVSPKTIYRDEKTQTTEGS